MSFDWGICYHSQILFSLSYSETMKLIRTRKLIFRKGPQKVHFKKCQKAVFVFLSSFTPVSKKLEKYVIFDALKTKSERRKRRMKTQKKKKKPLLSKTIRTSHLHK